MNGPRPADACPDCGADVAGVDDRCPACGAGLDAERLVTVFETADPMLLALVKSALESNDIAVVVQGEGALGLFPLGALGTGVSRNLLAATIQVPHRDAGAALDIIREAAQTRIDPEDDDDDESKDG